jgi:hypothetical protein
MKRFSEFVMESNQNISREDADHLMSLGLISKSSYLESLWKGGELNKFSITTTVEHNYLGSPDEKDSLISDLTHELEDAIDGIILAPDSIYIDDWEEPEEDEDSFLSVYVTFDIYTELEEPQVEEILASDLTAMLDSFAVHITKDEPA